MVQLKTLDTQHKDFDSELNALLSRQAVDDRSMVNTVSDIINDVRTRGDQAVLDYTRRFDGFEADSMTALEMPPTRLQQALSAIAPEQRAALEEAAARIREYAEHQKLQSWSYEDDHGNMLGQQIQPLERVGLYVPGGKAAYPSSVLMNAIPAKTAGVNELIMVVPTPAGVVNELVLAAAAIAGVDRVFNIGGAQAVAALAYGTDSIPRVDKIVGPGNIYVATAKRLVFGAVGIDMVAGPSEIVIVCDGQSDPDWIAMDLFSQAEHDEAAQAILITDDTAFLDSVSVSIDKLIGTMERKDIITASLQSRGAFIKVKDLSQAIDIVNRIAPEHLELSIENPARWTDEIKHAGAIFLGRYSAEVLGDYCAGPNHVLPTSGTARFASPLGVYDFQKRSSVVLCSPSGAGELAATASILARGEGLTAHARAAEYRLNRKNDT